MSYISASMKRNEQGFVEGDEVYVWECINHKHVLKRYPGIFEFYAKSKTGEYTSIFDEPLKKFTFNTYREFREAKKHAISEGLKLYESDISADTKILATHYYDKPSPDLNITLYDIENDFKTESYADDDEGLFRYNGKETKQLFGDIRSLDQKDLLSIEVYDDRTRKWIKYVNSKFEYFGQVGFSSPADPYAPISAISLHHEWLNKSVVLAVPPKGWDPCTLDKSLEELTEIRFFKDEKSLLINFLEEIQDSSILSGWNSRLYDDPYITKRIELLGKEYVKKLGFPQANAPRYMDIVSKGRTQLAVEWGGRVQLDYMELFKKFEVVERPSYALAAISEEVLPHLQKLHYDGTLEQLYNEDFNHFLRYNVRDTEVLAGFEKKLNYIKLANDMIHSSTNLFPHINGTVRMVDNAIINYCHYELNRIVPDRWDTKDGNIQGAYVLFPQRGLHKWICSIDINSLYPSAIRALNISPETMIGQFVGNIKDWECIADRVNADLTFRYEDGTYETRPTMEWVDFFTEMKWAVTGYGTVYSQTKVGVIPALLGSWYSLRKEYQALKKKFEKLAEENKHDKELYRKYSEEAKKNDRFQYIYKIKLNSTYGCLSNYNFRFFRLESGESVTGTGRMILRHQCREVNKLIEGNYNVDFPLYESNKVIDKLNKEHAAKYALDNEIDDLSYEMVSTHKSYNTFTELMDAGTKEYYHPNTLTYDISLNGPKFNGEFQSKTVIYGDSVAGNTIIYLEDRSIFIEDLMTSDIIALNGKEYCNLSNVRALTYDSTTDEICYKPIKYIMRHKCEKQMYRVWTSCNSYIDLTEDHSLMHYNGVSIEHVKPYEDIDRLIVNKFDIDKVELVNMQEFLSRCDKPLSKEEALYWCHQMATTGIFVSIIEKDDGYHIRRSIFDSSPCDKQFNTITPYKIEKIIYDDYVYDIEIEDTHTFFANNILCHNTDSTYFTAPVDNEDEAVEIADAVADQVNKSFPIFMRKAFLCQPEFDQLIACGREIVGDSGIFVEKKRYTIHVVDNEGKKSDKMKTMGLDIKKTTLPKPVALKLTSFVQRLLTNEDWKSISKDIVAYKSELMNFDNLLEMGLPKGVNKVEEYTLKYQDLGMKANLPGHVAASILYNIKLKEYNDLDSYPISSGTKIKVYYLKHKMGKFTSIALPTDAENIPEWFKEHFIHRLDKDKQIDRLVDKPLGNILKAIDVKVPTAQMLYAEELFIF